MRENLFRLTFLFLVTWIMLLVARNAFSQTLTVTPKICLAPCEVRLELRIKPAKENRWWSISYPLGESGGPLDEDSEYVHPVCLSNPAPCYRTLPEGTFTFVGCVHKLENGKLKPYCVTQEVVVEGRHGRQLYLSVLWRGSPYKQTRLQH